MNDIELLDRERAERVCALLDEQERKHWRNELRYIAVILVLIATCSWLLDRNDDLSLLVGSTITHEGGER